MKKTVFFVGFILGFATTYAEVRVVIPEEADRTIRIAADEFAK